MSQNQNGVGTQGDAGPSCFQREVDELRLVRQFARETLSEWGNKSHDVNLVVNEFAPNAVRYAQSALRSR